jgi:TolA-binding protein
MSEVEPTDLVCRARRESLSEEERRRLEHLLRTSLEVQLTSAALRQLDRESRVRRGDEALVERMVDRATLRLGRSRRHLLGPRVLLAALSVLLVGAVAGAVWVRPQVNHPARPAHLASAGSTVSGTARLEAGGVRPSVPSDGVQAPADPEPSAIPASAPAAAERGVGATARLETNQAGELFARANLLRRSGQEPEAARLYRAIVEGYPKAREASPARLALAKLEERDNPQRALAYYRSLAESGGRLRAEALWGMAESARRLGQTDVAARALSELVEEFPDSPYAEVARRRRQDEAR